MKTVTQTIDNVEMNGSMSGASFITKLDTGGYGAFQEGALVDTSDTKKVLVDKYRPVKTKDAPQVADIVVLPMSRRLFRGHILRVGKINGEVKGKANTYESEKELNIALASCINQATNAGYSPRICVNGRVHYLTTMERFKNDPRGAVNYVRNYEPVSSKKKVKSNDLPF